MLDDVQVYDHAVLSPHARRLLVVLAAVAALVLGLVAPAQAADGHVVGTVTGPGDAPIEDVWVDLYDPDNLDFIAGDLSDAQGNYDVAVPPGTLPGRLLRGRGELRAGAVRRHPRLRGHRRGHPRRRPGRGQRPGRRRADAVRLDLGSADDGRRRSTQRGAGLRRRRRDGRLGLGRARRQRTRSTDSAPGPTRSPSTGSAGSPTLRPSSTTTTRRKTGWPPPTPSRSPAARRAPTSTGCSSRAAT